MSLHFSKSELTASDTAVRLGIDNTPSPQIVANLEVLAMGLEDIRDILGHPVRINSGYRCPKLNTVIKGSRTSAHMEGYAADFTCPAFGTPLEVVKAIEKSPLAFDQCIQEGTWVHISFAPEERRRVLTAHFGPNGTTYTEGA